MKRPIYLSGRRSRALSGKSNHPRSVLAGLGPAIHEKPLVGPRAKPGDDELECSNFNGFASGAKPDQICLLQDVDERDKPGQKGGLSIPIPHSSAVNWPDGLNRTADCRNTPQPSSGGGTPAQSRAAF